MGDRVVVGRQRVAACQPVDVRGVRPAYHLFVAAVLEQEHRHTRRTREGPAAVRRWRGARPPATARHGCQTPDEAREPQNRPPDPAAVNASIAWTARGWAVERRRALGR